MDNNSDSDQNGPSSFFVFWGDTKLLSSFSLLFLAPKPGVALTIPATRFAQHAAALIITSFFVLCVKRWME